MNQYPSIISTYQRIFKLCAECFSWSLPFITFSFLITHFIFTPDLKVRLIDGTINKNEIMALSLTFFCGLLCSCITTYGIFRKFHFNTLNYSEALKNGLKRLPAYVTSVILRIIPAISIFFSFMIMTKYQSGLLLTSLILLTLIGTLLSVFLTVYCCASNVLIINKEMGALEGLKQSFRLINNNAFKTSLLLLPTLILPIFLQNFDMIGQIVSAIFSCLLFPALLIIHCDQLEKIKTV